MSDIYWPKSFLQCEGKLEILSDLYPLHEKKNEAHIK